MIRCRFSKCDSYSIELGIEKKKKQELIDFIQMLEKKATLTMVVKWTTETTTIYTKITTIIS